MKTKPTIPLTPFLLLVLLACLGLTIPGAIAAGRKALVIGNLNYADTGECPDLFTTRSDARKMAALLDQGEFQVRPVVLDASRIRMEEEIAAFAESLKPGDEAVFYFAGHGLQWENKVWLLGTNAEFKYKEKLGEEAVSNEFIANTLGSRGVKIAVLVLDCCREAPPQSWLASYIKKRGVRAAGQDKPAHLNPPQNILVGYATSSRRLTNDLLSPSDENGPLVRALTEHWPQGLEWDRLWKEVARDVYNRSLAAKRTNPDVEVQMPSKYGQTIHDFYFLPGGGAPVPPPPRQVTPRTATKERPFVNPLGMKFVPVPGTEVLFSIWETRVRDFAAFVNDPASGYDYAKGEDPFILTGQGWEQSSEASWKNPGFPQTDDHPVSCVSWEDARAFCAWLSRQDNGGRYTYRLPSDHEWSVAVGIGSREDATASPQDKDGEIEGVYPWGTARTPPATAGNYAGGELADDPVWKALNYSTIEGFSDRFTRTAPVASFGANNLGIHDLGGNLWEWCEDWYSNNHRYRVLRGGSWSNDSEIDLRSSRRSRDTPADRGDDYGFRCVLEFGGGG